jgi:hypothetical protein
VNLASVPFEWLVTVTSGFWFDGLSIRSDSPRARAVVGSFLTVPEGPRSDVLKVEDVEDDDFSASLPLKIPMMSSFLRGLPADRVN